MKPHQVSTVHGSAGNPTNAGAVPGSSGAQSSRWGGEPALRGARVERDTQPKPRDRQKWRRSLLHLVPLSISSQGDLTIIHWQKIVHTGKSIEQNHNMISIKGSGYYFIYTQVLYEDQTFVMGHIVRRRIPGSHTGEENLLRCTCNMPKEHPFATCYGAGIYKLQKGDTIELVIPRNSARVSKEKDSTFMGLLKLGPT
ncbi:tumor necrosis factor ligand superfamily member 13B-like [Mobula birostris]|uniref:tumor necrosis factor ligand superfamily member 13B-like n=1 Tax=Mobula birostris TaxID=1983395 RepID=UPI003B28BDF8